MVVGIGEALIAANLLGISAIASMWKDPNAVRTDAAAKGAPGAITPTIPPQLAGLYSTLTELLTTARSKYTTYNAAQRALASARTELVRANAASKSAYPALAEAVARRIADATSRVDTASDQLETAREDYRTSRSALADALSAYTNKYPTGTKTNDAAVSAASTAQAAADAKVATTKAARDAAQTAFANAVLEFDKKQTIKDFRTWIRFIDPIVRGKLKDRDFADSVYTQAVREAAAAKSAVEGATAFGAAEAEGPAAAIKAGFPKPDTINIPPELAPDAVGPGTGVGGTGGNDGTGSTGTIGPTGGTGGNDGTGSTGTIGPTGGTGGNDGTGSTGYTGGTGAGGSALDPNNPLTGDNGGGTGLQPLLQPDPLRPAGSGLDTTARDAERARVEALVHAIHPDAVVSINTEGGQQVIVGGSEVWTIVPTGEGVQFKAAGTEGTVPSIPGLATSQGPVEDQARLAAEAEAAAEQARLAAEAEAAAEQARLAEAYARASAEAEAEAKAGVRAAEQAALAQTAAEAEQARLAAEAGAAPATPVLGPAQPPSPGGFTLGTESDGSESEHRDRASSIQSTAPRTTWDTPEMPYLLKNGHPNPGFVLRFLQAYDAAPDKDQELRTLRDSFDKWWDQPADIGVKRALESWKDNSGQNYVGQRKNTDKFMDAVTRAHGVDRNEPSIAAAIENVPLARGNSMSTISQSDAGELNETSQYPSSATRTVPAPESPGSAPASPLPPVQMPPLPEPETPEESVRRLLREGQARTAEVAALASGNQAAQAAAANSIADRPAVRRPPLQELLASIPAGDTPEARDATERLREGIAARASAVNAQTEAAVNAASARRVTGSNEPLVKALLHRDPFGLNPAIERQLTRRGRGRKSTFRKKRKNKK